MIKQIMGYSFLIMVCSVLILFGAKITLAFAAFLSEVFS